MIYARLIVCVAILLAAAYCGYSLAANKYEREIAEITLTQESAQKDIAVAYAEKLNVETVKHDENLQLINSLSRDIKRLRIKPKSNCAATTPNSTDGGSGLFPETTDRDFEEVDYELAELIMRCDKLNVDAIRLNGLIKGENNG